MQEELHITLVGPPNAGKTTLFNLLTGANYKTVNYPGSTVHFSRGRARSSLKFQAEISDTPGITSLNPTSPDQQITIDHLIQDSANHIILAVADATQLGRHLYLVDRLIESGFQVVLCVTMLDLLEANGQSLDEKKLEEQLGVPVGAMDARKSMMAQHLAEVVKNFSGGDSEIRQPRQLSEDEIHLRYQKVENIANQAIVAGQGPAVRRLNPDDLFLHPILGGVIFAMVMVGVFASIFWAAEPFMNIIDTAFGIVIDAVKNTLPESWITDLLADGLIAGIGAVVIFLPQIIILFFFMGILEDSGYLARGAMVVDKPLTKIGLNGKAFVPMLSGFACAIPAIMAARTISSPRERLLTILIVPLMSCSARLPVYSLLLTFLLPGHSFYKGLALAGLYIWGLVSGSLAATLISRLPSFRRQRRSPLLLELPTFRQPLLRVICGGTWHRSYNYLKKAGPTIIVISLGLWLLTHLPAVQPGNTDDADYVTVEKSYAAKIGPLIEPATEPMGLDWRGGVSILMGFAAREVFVGSMVLMYRVEDSEDEQAVTEKLLGQMSQVTFAGTDQRVFTVSSVIGLLFFFSIALQCFPTVVIAKNEIGAWKIPLIQLFAYSGLAYLGAVFIVQLLRVCGLP